MSLKALSYPFILGSFVFGLACAVQAANSNDVTLLDPVPISGQATMAMHFAERTPFHKLRDLFEAQAKEPTPEDFRSWKSGRCFFADRPMQAVATMFATDSQNSSGPLFSDSTHQKVIPFVARQASANFFDNANEETFRKIGERIRKHRDDLAYPVRSNASLRIDVPRSLQLEARQYTFRKVQSQSRSYVILQMNCSDAGGCRSANYGRIYYTQDETAAYCYFFKSIKPK